MTVRGCCLVALLLSACLHEDWQTCASGAVCPPGTQCVDLRNAAAGSQLCAASSCGNGRLDPGEVCDDANNRSGDGCPADCGAPCGDGVQDPGETCDDGNTDDGDGCSANCQLREGGFAVSPSSVTLQVTEGDPLPPAIPLSVQLAYDGDSVLAGYAPGVSQPSWLALAEGVTTATTAVLELRMTDTATVGERTAHLRLTIRHRSSTGLETFDLPITYRVVPSDLAAHATPASLELSAVVDDVGMPSRALNVAFNGDAVALVSAPAWLTVTGPAAPASPAPFIATINSTAFAGGTTLGGEIVFATTRGRLQRTTRVHVDYHVNWPDALAVSATPSAISLAAVIGDSAPPQPVTVTFTGASVEVYYAPDWLTVTAAPAPSSPATFLLSASAAALHAGTVLTGELWFRTVRDGEEAVTQVPVELDVIHGPQVDFVAPYVGIAGRPGTLHLRGHGLQTGGPVTVRLGELPLPPVMPVNDTAVELAYPALPAGRYPVSVLAPAGLPSRSPELVIVAPPRFAYQVIPTAGLRTRIVYDPERQALYAVNQQGQQIEHFVYEAGAWSARPPHAIPLLTDLAMSPDGRSMIVLDSTMINEVSLSDPGFVPVERAALPIFYGSCDLFSEAAVASSGLVFVNTRSASAGSYWPCRAYFYDLLDPSLRELEIFAGGRCSASGDGSRIYAGAESGGASRVYDALTNAMVPSATLGSTFAWVNASEDGERVLVGTTVLDRSLNLLGSVPYHSANTALLARSGHRAFIYVEDDAGAHIDVYDLDSPTNPDGLYPVSKTVAIPDKANQYAFHTIRMTSSLDDATLFILGETRLLIVPVE